MTGRGEQTHWALVNTTTLGIGEHNHIGYRYHDGHASREPSPSIPLEVGASTCGSALRCPCSHEDSVTVFQVVRRKKKTWNENKECEESRVSWAIIQNKYNGSRRDRAENTTCQFSHYIFIARLTESRDGGREGVGQWLCV